MITLDIEQYDGINRHYKTQHQTENEGKQKLVFETELRKEYVAKKKEEIRRQNVFTPKSCERLAMTEASYEIALALAKKGKQMKLRFLSRLLRDVPMMWWWCVSAIERTCQNLHFLFISIAQINWYMWCSPVKHIHMRNWWWFQCLWRTSQSWVTSWKWRIRHIRQSEIGPGKYTPFF